MGKDKGFRKINELVAALGEAERALLSGGMGVEGLDAACANARELYERFVVLRHKAREAALNNPPSSPATRLPTPSVALSAEEPKPMRLDTRPPVSPHQTSLIEAIAATEEGEGHVPEPAAKKDEAESRVEPSASRTTLAEKHEHASIADLGRAISLSHKFWFVAELFNGDRITYEKSIDRLNALLSREEAEAFVDGEVVAKLKKPADPEALSTFLELVHRRFA
jgi:hypothetical protein